jgi:hypothetical protein
MVRERLEAERGWRDGRISVEGKSVETRACEGYIGERLL